MILKMISLPAIPKSSAVAKIAKVNLLADLYNSASISTDVFGIVGEFLGNNIFVWYVEAFHREINTIFDVLKHPLTFNNAITKKIKPQIDVYNRGHKAFTKIFSDLQKTEFFRVPDGLDLFVSANLIGFCVKSLENSLKPLKTAVETALKEARQKKESGVCKDLIQVLVDIGQLKENLQNSINLLQSVSYDMTHPTEPIRKLLIKGSSTRPELWDYLCSNPNYVPSNPNYLSEVNGVNFMYRSYKGDFYLHMKQWTIMETLERLGLEVGSVKTQRILDGIGKLGNDGRFDSR